MNAATADPLRRYTKQDYLELLDQSEHKYDYLDGEVRTMAGGTVAHNTILDNTTFALRLLARGCQIKGSETAIAVAAANRYHFPDVSAVCDTPTYEQGGIARLTNPALIVEVLSETSAAYDRGEKFSAYRQLPSFREYLLIDSRKLIVETYFREEKDLWRIGNSYDLGQVVRLRSLGINLPLQDIYLNVVFGGGE
ncbi:Uma2 family endonuclease [Neolewinella sp.]|uniref:Uma2 family endonuclease n=1 Tax=Neolewinella sp. TaxID=2993543 RepID=UPI003B527ADC